MLTTRLATVADAPAIAAIHIDSWRAAYRGIVPDAFLDALSAAEREPVWRARLAVPPPDTYVAEAARAVVGWATVSGCRDADAGPASRPRSAAEERGDRAAP